LLVWLLKSAAFVVFAFGLLRLGLGIYVAQQFPEPAQNAAAAARYLAAANSGDAIDRGIWTIIVALGLSLAAAIVSRIVRS